MADFCERLFWWSLHHNLLNWIPDSIYLKWRFKKNVGYPLNLKNPKTFNEKLQWIKLNDRRLIYNTMVDKYEVYDFIKKRIGEKYLIPLIGVWDRVEDVDYNSLPNQFVLKTTHDSGGVIICRDKTDLDIESANQKLKRSLERDYYKFGREWPYKDLKHRIIAQKLMTDESGTELRDYKVLCFDGKAKLIQYHMGRYKNHTQDYYDRDWNKLDIYQGCPLSDIVLPKPDFLDEMLRLSELLAEGFPELRVDWYFANGQLYFGELTLFDASGMDPFERYEDDLMLGSWITLPGMENKNE